MPYVIAEPCVNVKDRSCVDVCPVDCIYEGPDMLYIHPDECIDCGAGEFSRSRGLGALALRLSGRVLALEDVAVLSDVVLPLRRDILFGEDRRHQAFRLARAAVD